MTHARSHGWPLATTFVLTLGLAVPAVAAPGGVLSLSPRADRRATIVLPADGARPVGATIPFVGHASGGFATEFDGSTLRLDTDGDGEVDRSIAPPKPGEAALVTLRGIDAAGGATSYPVRFEYGAKGWSWRHGGSMEGQLGFERVRLIDMNGNGRFDDYGADAMVVGRGVAASYLSKVIAVRGSLLAIDVTPDGRTLSYEPYTGATGTLDATSALTSDARVLSLIVRSEDGKHSFDLASATTGTLVPEGRYRVAQGRLGLGKHVVMLEQGRMEPLVVKADAPRTVTWGGPAIAEFDYQRTGDTVVFSPDMVWYYGAAGETYTGWNPIGKSPEFTVKKKTSGEVLEVAILPGSS